MSMDWENERYVRLYTRDSMTWKLLGFTGQTMLSRLLRKLDRAGVAELHEYSTPEGLATFLDVPPEYMEFALDGIAKMVTRGVILIRDGYCYMPNFLDAQDASQSETQRQRESRAKRADRARAGELGVTKRDETPGASVTKRDSDVTNRDEPPGGDLRNVTPARPASPSRPSRPASAEKRAKKAAATGSTVSAGGRKPPAGRKAEKRAAELVASGKLDLHDVEACWAYCDAEGVFDDPPAKADARALALINQQRPAQRTNGTSVRAETEYDERPPWLL